MSLQPSAFDYLKPTEAQQKLMEDLRMRARHYADALERELPDGPDKTFILRKFREVAMWVNVCVTRKEDGTPRA